MPRSGRNIPAGELSRMTEMIRDKYDKTIVEHWHGGIENRCTPILAALRNLDLTFWSDKEKCGVFLYFLTHQLFRTPKMKNAMSRLQFNNSVEGLDLKRIWAIDSLLFANVLGANLYLDREKYTIKYLRNDGQVPFITSDQPVINLKTEHDTDVSLYYPLSPRLAIILMPQSLCGERMAHIGRFETEFYNYRLFTSCEDQLYGNDKDYLHAIAKMPRDLQ